MNKQKCIDIIDNLIIAGRQAEQTKGLKNKIKALEHARACVEVSDISVGNKEDE